MNKKKSKAALIQCEKPVIVERFPFQTNQVLEEKRSTVNWKGLNRTILLEIITFKKMVRACSVLFYI